MKTTNIALISSLVAAAPCFAEENTGFDPAKMQEVMEKYATPGPEHEYFKPFVGTWKAESSYWMRPGTSPMTSTGTETVRLTMGGRYLVSTFKAKSDQFGPFQGRSTLAYDRLEKEFVQTWIDSMGTGIMHSKGKLLDDGKSLELKSDMMDPMTMQRVTYRMVSTSPEGGKRTMEMFITYPGKEEYRTMLINYALAKEGGAAN